MNHERNAPPADPGEIPEAIIQPDGSLNEALLIERYGFGTEVASQEVKFGKYNGTVAQMLSDEDCPVGSVLQEAYQEKGIDGVAEKLKTFSELDPRFSVTIPDTTFERKHEKKKRIQLKI